MPSDPFPEQLDASKLFVRKVEINAVLPFSRLKRFVDCLSEPNGQVAVHLRFGHDEQGRRKLSGELSTRVKQVCQRCLQPFETDLECELDLLVLTSETELEALPEADALTTDVIVDEAEELDVLAIIEDELILSLPLAPVHQDESCNKALNSLKLQVENQSGKQTGKVEVESKPNPFAALAALKKDSGQDN
jgi:uncharacterized protein